MRKTRKGSLALRACMTALLIAPLGLAGCQPRNDEEPTSDMTVAEVTAEDVIATENLPEGVSLIDMDTVRQIIGGKWLMAKNPSGNWYELVSGNTTVIPVVWLRTTHGEILMVEITSNSVLISADSDLSDVGAWIDYDQQRAVLHIPSRDLPTMANASDVVAKATAQDEQNPPAKE